VRAQACNPSNGNFLRASCQESQLEQQTVQQQRRGQCTPGPREKVPLLSCTGGVLTWIKFSDSSKVGRQSSPAKEDEQSLSMWIGAAKTATLLGDRSSCTSRMGHAFYTEQQTKGGVSGSQYKGLLFMVAIIGWQAV
jgi:hypothetical protein